VFRGAATSRTSGGCPRRLSCAHRELGAYSIRAMYVAISSEASATVGELCK